ncbi:hypothetical protein KC867_02845 [Candidatus Saccharibacteria bacterium]|nr:hypothetical protein [Candidatus Saccharibacteria bacterium]
MNERQLQAVYLDNIRTMQIGGETDGITQEVAEDIGYMPYDKLPIHIDESVKFEEASEAMPDVELSPKASSSIHSGRLFELPSRSRPNPADAIPVSVTKGKTPEEIEQQRLINQAGILMARRALYGIQDDDIDSEDDA